MDAHFKSKPKKNIISGGNKTNINTSYHAQFDDKSKILTLSSLSK